MLLCMPFANVNKTVFCIFSITFSFKTFFTIMQHSMEVEMILGMSFANVAKFYSNTISFHFIVPPETLCPLSWLSI